MVEKLNTVRTAHLESILIAFDGSVVRRETHESKPNGGYIILANLSSRKRHFCAAGVIGEKVRWRIGC